MQKFLKNYNLVPSVLDQIPDATLGEWYVNLVQTCLGEAIVFVNAPTRLTVVLPVAWISSIEKDFCARLLALYQRLEFPRDFILRESKLLNNCVYTKTQDRSMIGSMNDIGHHLQSSTETVVSGARFSLESFEDRMSVLPQGPFKYRMPIEVAWSIMAPKLRGEFDYEVSVKKIIRRILSNFDSVLLDILP